MTTDTGARIFVAGHLGMVGSAIVRALLKSGVESSQIITKTRSELDLTRQADVEAFFRTERPALVYLAAARVGGIYANYTHPAEFILENLQIEANVIASSFMFGVQKLLFLGSSCIYPREAPQPMSEEALLTGRLEPTNEPYAIAKIAGIKLCESFNRQFGVSHNVDYRSVMPTNLYGPGDNYHQEHSHVIPSLIRRFHQAKQDRAPSVTIWGTGTPKREFLFVDDMAAACIYVMNLPKTVYERETQAMHSHINVGCGHDISILDLATTVAKVVGFYGEILVDPTKPDGAPRKLIDSSLLNRLGWTATVGLHKGLELTYADYLGNLR